MLWLAVPAEVPKEWAGAEDEVPLPNPVAGAQVVDAFAGAAINAPPRISPAAAGIDAILTVLFMMFSNVCRFLVRVSGTYLKTDWITTPVRG